MKQSELKVKIIAHTPNPEMVIASAAKLCYSKVGVDKIQDNLTPENVEKFLNMLVSIGHESPLEHVSFTFAIEGVSRVLLSQITRHRLASFSVQSQRYVNLAESFEYILPNEIEKRPILKERFLNELEADIKAYNYIADSLKDEYIKEGLTPKQAEKKAIENARYILPNCCETKMVFTMNIRSLYNFLSLRNCSRAQDEIEQLSEEMLLQLRDISPILFNKAGAPCMRGKCPEGVMSCGVKKG